MARAILSIPVQDTLGNAVTTASVYVYKRGTGIVNGTTYSGTVTAETIYSGKTGVGTLTNPLSPNSNGMVTAYTNDETEVDLVTVIPGRNAILTPSGFAYDTADDKLGRVIRATQAPHNARCDGRQFATATTTVGVKTVTVSGGNFTQDDVGKIVSIEGGVAVREVTDAVVTMGSTSVTSVTIALTGNDIGRVAVVNQAEYQGSTMRSIIQSVPTAAQMILDRAAIQSVTGVSLHLVAPVFHSTIASVQSSSQITLADADTITRSAATITVGSDDTTAIASAILAASLANAILELPRGITFVNSTVALGSNVTIRGAGMGLTTIKRAPGFTGFNSNLTYQNYATASMFVAEVGTSNVAFEDLTIDNTHWDLDEGANSLGGYTGEHRCAILFKTRSQYTALRRVRVINAKTNAVRWDGGPLTGVPLLPVPYSDQPDRNYHKDVTIEGCEFLEGSGTDGGTFRVTIYNAIRLRVENCLFSGASGLIQDTYSAYPLVFTPYPYEIPQTIRFLNNTFVNCPNSNLLVRENDNDIDDIQIVGNTFRNAGATLPEHKGFIVCGENSGNRRIPNITRVLIANNQGRGFKNFGISVGNLSALADVSVVDNHLWGRSTDGVLTTGCVGIGIRGGFNSDPAVNAGGTCYDLVIRGNHIFETGRAGISIEVASDGVIDGNTLVRCAQTTTDDALHADPASTGAISVSGGSLAATDFAITNNIIREAGSNVSPTTSVHERPAIGFAGTPAIKNVLVSGNRVHDERASNFTNYGVQIGASAAAPTDMPSLITITNNDFTGVLRAGVNATRPGGASQIGVWAYGNRDPLGPNEFAVASTTVTGTTGATLLRTKTLPATTLHSVALLRVKVHGTLTNTNGTKDIKLFLGSTLLCWISLLAANVSDWKMEVEIYPVVAGVQRVHALGWHGTTLVVQDYLEAAEDMTTDLALALTGQLGSGSDVITNKLWLVRPEAPF